MTMTSMHDMMARLTDQASAFATELAARDSMRADIDRARTILTAAFEAWDKPNPFVQGQMLKVARHSSRWKAEVGHVMVLRTHELSETIDETSGVVQSVDMRVLVIETGGVVEELAVHSRDFVAAEQPT